MNFSKKDLILFNLLSLVILIAIKDAFSHPVVPGLTLIDSPSPENFPENLKSEQKTPEDKDNAIELPEFPGFTLEISPEYLKSLKTSDSNVEGIELPGYMHPGFTLEVSPEHLKSSSENAESAFPGFFKYSVVDSLQSKKTAESTIETMELPGSLFPGFTFEIASENLKSSSENTEAIHLTNFPDFFTFSLGDSSQSVKKSESNNTLKQSISPSELSTEHVKSLKTTEPNTEAIELSNFPGFFTYEISPEYLKSLTSDSNVEAIKLRDSTGLNSEQSISTPEISSDSLKISNADKISLPAFMHPGFTLELSPDYLKSLKTSDNKATKQFGSEFPGFTLEVLSDNLKSLIKSDSGNEATKQFASQSQGFTLEVLPKNLKASKSSDSNVNKIELPAFMYPGFTLEYVPEHLKSSVESAEATHLSESIFPGFFTYSVDDSSQSIKKSESNIIETKELASFAFPGFFAYSVGDDSIQSIKKSELNIETMELPGSMFPGFTLEIAPEYLKSSSENDDTKNLPGFPGFFTYSVGDFPQSIKKADSNKEKINELLEKITEAVHAEADTENLSNPEFIKIESNSDEAKNKSREPSLKPNPVQFGVNVEMPYLFPYLFPGNNYPGFTLKPENIIPPGISAISSSLIPTFPSEKKSRKPEDLDEHLEKETTGVSRPLTPAETFNVAATSHLFINPGKNQTEVLSVPNASTGSQETSEIGLVFLDDSISTDTNNEKEEAASQLVSISPDLSTLPSNISAPSVSASNPESDTASSNEVVSPKDKESPINPTAPNKPVYYGDFLMTRPLYKPQRPESPVNSHSFHTALTNSENQKPFFHGTNRVPILQVTPSDSSFETKLEKLINPVENQIQNNNPSSQNLPTEKEAEFFLGLLPDQSGGATPVIVKKPNPEEVTSDLLQYLEKALGRYKNFSAEESSDSDQNDDEKIPDDVKDPEVAPAQDAIKSQAEEQTGSAVNIASEIHKVPISEPSSISNEEENLASSNQTEKVQVSANELKPIHTNIINKTDTSLTYIVSVKPVKPSKVNNKPSRPRPEYGIQTPKKPEESLNSNDTQSNVSFLVNPVTLPGWLVPSFKWPSFNNIFFPFFKNRGGNNNVTGGDKTSINSSLLRLGIDTDCSEDDDFEEHIPSDSMRETVDDDKFLCQSIEETSECSKFCERSGFASGGSCIDGERCVCHLGEESRFGLVFKKFDFEETAEKLQGSLRETCKRCSCSADCQRSGSYIGYCDNSCMCGLPWHDGTLDL